jgi:Predicted Zn-dependent peptidases
MRSSLLLLAALGACAPKQPATPAPATVQADPDAWRTTPPQPLPNRPFELPAVETATLSNGLKVDLVENHEVPLVYVQLVFQGGGWSDPAGKRGLADVTMSMLSEGAGDLDAQGLSLALKKLATDLSTGAGIDGAHVDLKSLKEKLGPSLDLMKLVVTRPTFAKADWTLMQKQRLQDLESARDTAKQIAGRVTNHLAYGDVYAGRLTNEAAYKSITTGDMRGWWKQHVRPDQALLLVGGDITMDELKPLLEQRFGTWKAAGKAPDASLPQASALPTHDQTTIFLVDKPGATQSVLRMSQPVGDRKAPDYTAFELANAVMGGQFISRINMDLREDKGWTYGAWSWDDQNHLGGRWEVGTSVVTPATAPAVKEVLDILKASEGDKPITADELSATRGYLLGTFPVRFENPGYLLGQTEDIWRYDLPADWPQSFPDRVRAVDLAAANQALKHYVDPARLVIVVVGDAAKVKDDLARLAPVVMVDADGVPVDSGSADDK